MSRVWWANVYNVCPRGTDVTGGFGGRYPSANSQALGVLACFLFWFLLFYVTGLFSSAFHLIDEHILVEIHADLAGPDAHLGTVVKKWMVMDFNERRFRPLYYISRVLRTELFGLSWPAWSLYNAFLAASTSAALFLFGTLLGFTTFSSLCLAALSTLGRPSTIWWRLGTPETEANFLLALAFLCIARAVTQENTRIRNELAAIVLSLLASLTKEAMILYLPAIAAIRVWLPCWLYGRTLKSALLDAWPFIAVLGFIAAIEFLCLLLTVGTSGTGYAGVDAETFDPGRIGFSLKALAPVTAFRILVAAMAIALLARVLYRRANTESHFCATDVGMAGVPDRGGSASAVIFQVGLGGSLLQSHRHQLRIVVGAVDRICAAYKPLDLSGLCSVPCAADQSAVQVDA